MVVFNGGVQAKSYSYCPLNVSFSAATTLPDTKREQSLAMTEFGSVELREV